MPTAAAPTPAPISADEVRAAIPLFVGNPACRELGTQQDPAPRCALTTRLQTYIDSHQYTSGGGGSEWTRSQFVWAISSITVDQTPTGATAHVTLNPNGTPGYSLNLLDFFFVKAGGQLLVDDVQCTGKGDATSLYHFPDGNAPLCYTSQ